MIHHKKFRQCELCGSKDTNKLVTVSIGPAGNTYICHRPLTTNGRVSGCNGVDPAR